MIRQIEIQPFNLAMYLLILIMVSQTNQRIELADDCVKRCQDPLACPPKEILGSN